MKLLKCMPHIAVILVTVAFVVSCDPETIVKEPENNQEEVEDKPTNPDKPDNSTDPDNPDKPTDPDNPNEPTDPDKPSKIEVADDFDSGDGSAKNPYMIANAAQLRKLAKDLESGMTYREEYFKLKNDIVVNKKVLNENGELVTDHSDLEQWKPIDKFYGTFDGDGHSISGIYINTERSNQGLFGHLYGEVSNLSLTDSYIRGEDYVGGIAARAHLYRKEKLYVANIINCVNKATIKGHYYVGGIVGVCGSDDENKPVNRCGNYGNIIADEWAGGIAGRGGKIYNSYNYGKVTADQSAAGICAYCALATFSNCVNLGIVTSNSSYAAGLFEYFRSRYDSELNNCVNYGTVASNNKEYAAVVCRIEEDDHIRVKGKNLYYLETSAKGFKYSGDGRFSDCGSRTLKQMKAPEFLNTLNSNVNKLNSQNGFKNYYCKWKTGSEGYPILEIINE